MSTTTDLGPAVEAEVALDMVKRGLKVAPVLLAVAAIGWGGPGLASAAFSVAIVLVNFGLSAAMLAWAARHGAAALMAAALFGYIFRLGLVTAAVVSVHNQSWVEMLPLGLTLIVTHLGLLFWETRYVSISLAHPGLRPTNKGI